MTRKHYDHVDMMCLHINQLEKRLEVLEKIMCNATTPPPQSATHTHTNTTPIPQTKMPPTDEKHTQLYSSRRRFLM